MNLYEILTIIILLLVLLLIGYTYMKNNKSPLQATELNQDTTKINIYSSVLPEMIKQLDSTGDISIIDITSKDIMDTFNRIIDIGIISSKIIDPINKTLILDRFNKNKKSLQIIKNNKDLIDLKKDITDNIIYLQNTDINILQIELQKQIGLINDLQKKDVVDIQTNLNNLNKFLTDLQNLQKSDIINLQNLQKSDIINLQKNINNLTTSLNNLQLLYKTDVTDLLNKISILNTSFTNLQTVQQKDVVDLQNKITNLNTLLTNLSNLELKDVADLKASLSSLNTSLKNDINNLQILFIYSAYNK